MFFLLVLYRCPNHPAGARDQIKIRGESQAKNHKFHVFN